MPKTPLSPREIAIERMAPTPLHRIILQQPPAPHELLVPCWIWPHGVSSGKPVMRIGRDVRHPVKFFHEGTRIIRKVCAEDLCVNPRHFIMLPRPSTAMQHILVFQAEETIDNFKTLEDAYNGIDYPRIHVLEAWRNKIQLRLIDYDRRQSLKRHS